MRIVQRKYARRPVAREYHLPRIRDVVRGAHAAAAHTRAPCPTDHSALRLRVGVEEPPLFHRYVQLRIVICGPPNPHPTIWDRIVG